MPAFLFISIAWYPPPNTPCSGTLTSFQFLTSIKVCPLPLKVVSCLLRSFYLHLNQLPPCYFHNQFLLALQISPQVSLPQRGLLRPLYQTGPPAMVFTGFLCNFFYSWRLCICISYYLSPAWRLWVCLPGRFPSSQLYCFDELISILPCWHNPDFPD